MNLARAFAKQSPNSIFAEAIAGILFIGYVDYVTGYGISVFIFYGVPIFAAAWYCSKNLGVLAALIAGLTWWWADLMSGHPYDYSWIQGWETTMRLGFFMFVALAGAALRQHQLEIANRIALLEHSQKLEREIVGISEREQCRIGRDLHDGLCQYLAALGCAAASLAGDLEKRELRTESTLASDLAKFLQDAVVQARDLARGLMPVQMHDAALALALENLAASVSRLQRVQCTFASEGSIAQYDEPSAMHLYRIAQEAINNATRHGKAQKIDISLRTTNESTVLSITDDGIGMANCAPTERGMGLNIMTYRARLTGGELRVNESKGGGTTVSCVINPEVATST